MKPEILSIDDPIISKLLRDFRIPGTNLRAQLKGASQYRSAVFPDLTSSKQIFLEYLDANQLVLPPITWRWMQALRFSLLGISLFPIWLVLAVYHQDARPVLWLESILLFAFVGLTHLGCNLWNDYEDHLRGVDSSDHYGGSGVIQKLWIPAVHLRNVAAVFLCAGISAGITLFTLLPAYLLAPMLLVGLVGIFGAVSYSGWPFHYKYFSFSEWLVFLLSGPVVAMGASLIFFRDPAYFLWFSLISLPLATLVVLRLHTGNMVRIPLDVISHSNTIARTLGFPQSKLVFSSLGFVAPLLIIGLVMANQLQVSALLTLLSLPIFLSSLPLLFRARGPLDPQAKKLKFYVITYQYCFAFLFCLSFYFHL